MEITWLGQAGLLFETPQVCIMIDPYFSDSCEKQNPTLKRRIPINKEFAQKTPDILILTHHHLDHTDPETLPLFLNENNSICVISSRAAHELVRSFPGRNNCVIFEPGTRWTAGDVTISAVKAFHSEITAFGVIMEHEKKKYYVTGDTLYNTEILKSLPDDIYAVFLPVNGVGNNMNMEDASAFAMDTGAKWAVPLHWGMFDDLDPRVFSHPGRRIPKVYEKLRFGDER